SRNRRSGESAMPYFFWTLVPPPSGILPPLIMAWPPTSFSASTRITEQPASHATIAAGSPVAPAPIATTSASRSQSTGSWHVATPGTALPNVRVIILLPLTLICPDRLVAVDCEDRRPETRTGLPRLRPHLIRSAAPYTPRRRNAATRSGEVR